MLKIDTEFVTKGGRTTKVTEYTAQQLSSTKSIALIGKMLEPEIWNRDIWVHMPEATKSSDSPENSRLAKAACPPFYSTVCTVAKRSENTKPQANVS